ncbi:MAG: hypothetical protein HOP33_05955 [Verrucomicrobia bacterium]|nr:hypothetical protein [Verrucomicrobiota bacterium]
MKLKKQFRIRENGTSEVLYRFFRALNSSTVGVDDIKYEARTGESFKLLKLDMLVALCRGCGLKRSKFGDVGTYGFVVTREYEEKDFVACDYLCVLGLQGRNMKHEEKRDALGRLLIGPGNPERLESFGQDNHRIVVSHQIREMIKEKELRGLTFQEACFEEKNSKQSVGRYYELRASKTLPKLANTRQLMCYGMEPTGKVETFKGDYSRMVFIDDPPYALGEIHYRRSNIEALGNFDVAETFEHLWIPQRSLVISQRFYQFCLENDIPLTVLPVRIDQV